MGYGGFISVWDISDIVKPRKVANIATDGIIMHYLVIRGNFLYACAGNDGIVIFDIANPRYPQRIISIP